MQALKKELGLLVPTMKCFLDVENLASIGDLEALIDNSESVLAFLSTGYVSRWNCLREARQALVAKKNMILLRETQAMHGGGGIRALFEEFEAAKNQSLYAAFDAAHAAPGVAEFRQLLTEKASHELILWHRVLPS